jgi:hypothetical protein
MGFGHIEGKKKLEEKRGGNVLEPVPVRRLRHAMSGDFSYAPTGIRTDFRSSSLPFCPILYIDGERKNKIGHLQQPLVSWQKQFYLDIGTAAHELWQRVLTRAADHAPMEVDPFGSWKCTHCNKLIKNRFLPDPHKCGPHKNGVYTLAEFADQQDPNMTGYEIKKLYGIRGPFAQWDYVEVDFEYKGLTGHTDWIEYYPQDDAYAILDLKTAGSKAVSSPEKELPVLKNVLQIETYCYIIPKLPELTKYIPRIDHYVLPYQTRESPNQWHPYHVEWTDEREVRAGKRVNRWTKGFKLAKDYMAKPSLNALQDVVEVRPCISEKSYDREMSCKFEFGGRCEYVNICTKYEASQLTKRLSLALDASVDEHAKLVKKEMRGKHV